MSQTEQQRQVYRIQYREPDHARLQTPLGDFAVLNCSEAGLCYQFSGDTLPEVSRTFQGRLLFNTGDSVDIAGFVLWTKSDRVALRFTRSISAALIMNEQRWLKEQAAQQARAAAAK